MRIVSLIASSTEIVCALGFEDQLVGRSHECDYPPSVTRLPAVTAPKFKTEGTSLEVDERVRAIVEQGLSVYRVDAEALDRLAPDVIITQTQCEVCAVSLRDVEEAVCRMVHSHPRIVSLEPNRLSDVWADIRRVAEALGAKDKGEKLVADLGKRLRTLFGKTAVGPRPSVAYIEWIEPLMVGGNWMPELIEIAGGRNLFGESGKHSPALKWKKFVAADPDVIVVAPCGFDIARSQSEMASLTRLPEWEKLRAVREKRVAIADGNQFFNRPGPRLVESAEILAEIIRPDVGGYGHENKGWIRF
jgi:iron complex transport system substrate-binding protein